MLFLHPSKFHKILQQHIVLYQEDIDVINKAIESNVFSDIEKAKKAIGKLVPVQTLVTRNGKVFTETVYINPDKRKPEDVQQKYRKTKEWEYKRDDTNSIILDSNILKRGDLVKIKLQDGTETFGQFRHISVESKSGKPKVIIRAKIKNRKGELVDKTIERNPEDVILVNTKNEGEKKVTKRQFDPNSFNVGDSVTVSVRTKDENKNPIINEKEGVLVRKIGYGFVVLLEDGNYVDRPASTLRKTGESKEKLTKQQEIVLNKAMKRIKNAIKDKLNLIYVFEKRKTSNWESEVSKLRTAIEEDKNMQYNYFQVFKGNLKFEDIATEREKKVTPWSEE